jgi:pimeloyl-ACP methyl ester carboxylesterase
MAEDVIVLLDFVGWTERRSLHVVGLSLGGMIAQGALVAQNLLIPDLVGSFTELTYRIPERFISLSLVVTTAGGYMFNIPPVSRIEAQFNGD